MDPPAEKVPKVSITDILEGRLTGFEVDDDDLFGLAEYVDVEERDIQEAAARKALLATTIKDSCSRLFGELQEKAKRLKATQAEQKARRSGKKRRGAEAASVHDGAAHPPRGADPLPAGGPPS
eukprot:6106071-Pyramimonas_sp.AAC.1